MAQVDSMRLHFGSSLGFIFTIVVALLFILLGITIAASATSLISIIFGVIAFLLGMWLIVSFKRQTLILDKSTDTISYVSSSFLSQGNKEKLKLKSVAAVKFAKTTMGGRRKREEGIIFLKQRDGKETVLRGLVNEEWDARRIADFLAVPFELDQRLYHNLRAPA